MDKGTWGVAAAARAILIRLRQQAPRRQALLSSSWLRKHQRAPGQALLWPGRFHPSHSSKRPGNKHSFHFLAQEAARGTWPVTARDCPGSHSRGSFIWSKAASRETTSTPIGFLNWEADGAPRCSLPWPRQNCMGCGSKHRQGRSIFTARCPRTTIISCHPSSPCSTLYTPLAVWQWETWPSLRWDPGIHPVFGNQPGFTEVGIRWNSG